MHFKGKSPPLKLGMFWQRIIGKYELLSEDHPIIERLATAGLGPDLRLTRRQSAARGKDDNGNR